MPYLCTNLYNVAFIVYLPSLLGIEASLISEYTNNLSR